MSNSNDINTLERSLHRYRIPLDSVRLCKNYETIKIGCELLYLSKEDILFMMDKDTTESMASARLKQRRLEQPI